MSREKIEKVAEEIYRLIKESGGSEHLSSSFKVIVDNKKVKGNLMIQARELLEREGIIEYDAFHYKMTIIDWDFKGFKELRAKQIREEQDYQSSKKWSLLANKVAVIGVVVSIILGIISVYQWHSNNQLKQKIEELEMEIDSLKASDVLQIRHKY